VDTFACCSREAAENHFVRAKDLAGMVEAVSEKLRGQGEYVEWWDRQPKAAGNRYGHPGSGTAARVGQVGIPAKNVLQTSWRQTDEVKSRPRRQAAQKPVAPVQRVKCWHSITLSATLFWRVGL
jgi:hypothetical protein